MKKTLIALAVLAASGASFAQVTITGNLTAGYQATTNAAQNGVGANDTAGFGTDTSEINFAATEDLGGGMKITAKMGLSGADRSMESRGTVRGVDSSLVLQTNAGVFAIASVQAPDYLSGTLAGVGAYYAGFDGKVFGARTNRDVVSYSVPVGAFTLATSYQETSATANQGLGLGTTGASSVTGQSLVTLGATYAKGPLAANFTYLNFNSKEAALANRDQTRLSGNYDLGAVKLGLGAVLTNITAAAAGLPNIKVTDMLIGASVPMGAVTLGAEIVSRKIDDMPATAASGSGTATGASLQLGYALSKRTNMIANYARWTQTVAGGLVAGQDSSSQYQLLLSHSF